jgi:hypothetical protein
MTSNEIASLSKRIAALEANRPERAVPDPIPAWMEEHLVEVREILDDMAESEGAAMGDVPEGWSERLSPYSFLAVITMLTRWHRSYCQSFDQAIEVAREAVLHSGPCQPTGRMLARLWPDRDPTDCDDWTLGLDIPAPPQDAFGVDPDWTTLNFWYRELERRRPPSLNPETSNVPR